MEAHTNFMNYQALSPHCGYIESEPGIICPKIGVVVGKKDTLYFDTGASQKQLEILRGLQKAGKLPNPSTLAISHFHNDHIANFAYFSSCEVYGSKQTGKYVRVDHGYKPISFRLIVASAPSKIKEANRIGPAFLIALKGKEIYNKFRRANALRGKPHGR